MDSKTLDFKAVRKPDKEYWEYVKFKSSTAKQTSPFIIISNNSKHINTTHYYQDVLESDADAIVFHAWPGKWNTDVFVYTVKKAFRHLI
jgi:hypothetical protein